MGRERGEWYLVLSAGLGPTIVDRGRIELPPPKQTGSGSYDTYLLPWARMLEKAKPDPDLSEIGYEYEVYQAYLQAALSNALFAGPDKGLALAEQAQSREEALQAAMGFEKDTLLFFYDLRDMVSEAERKTITAIINEEKAHLRRLAKI